MIIDEQIIDDFIRLQHQLDKFLSISGRVTYGYICEKMGIARATFRTKMQKRNFTGQEMKRLAKILNDIRV